MLALFLLSEARFNLQSDSFLGCDMLLSNSAFSRASFFSLEFPISVHPI